MNMQAAGKRINKSTMDPTKIIIQGTKKRWSGEAGL